MVRIKNDAGKREWVCNMKRFVRIAVIDSLILGLLFNGLLPTYARAADVCSLGVGEPPFLSFGTRHNLLLLFDNSGSMLDLAYIDDTEQCYDDTYDNTMMYGGYFNYLSWYSYDFATHERFESESAMPAVCGTAEYFSQDALGSKFVCVDLDTSTDPDTVTGFAATGNFLNWASASKFDIQKEILTGGKYDDINDNLQLESRGCMNRRFVKQVDLAQGDYKLVLGVRGPMETYQTWVSGLSYAAGDIVFSGNVLYKANAAHTASDDFSTDSAKWDEYKETRWYPNQTYPANTAVYDVATDAWYWTQSGGTSLATATDITGDTSVTWDHYGGTSIEIFNIVEDGFDMDACQLAISLIGTLTGDEALDGDTNNPNTNLGKLKQATEDCMGFDPGGGNTHETARKASFNHAMQECWYYNKFGHWQPGAGTVNSMKTACANVYDYMEPEDITPWDSAYVCKGSYQPENDKSPYGYVGRCWEVPGAVGNCEDAECPDGGSSTVPWTEGSETYVCYNNLLMQCNKNNCAHLPATKPEDWDVVQDCEVAGGGDTGPGWTNDDFYYFNPCTYKTCMENNDLLDTCTSIVFNDFSCTEDGTTWQCHENTGDGDNNTDYCYTPDAAGDLCVDQAIKDFCNIISVPEVIDPSDSSSLTGEVWNAPAFLVDGGLVSQMELPLATMRGYVKQTTPPEGILHSTANDLRIGAMAFNSVGALTECASDDPGDAIEKYCPPGNKDGASVIAEIKLGSENTGTQTHAEDLVDALNEVRATSWTPLSEAMYTAIGYYTQDDAMKLDVADFTVGNDPVTDFCQENHILIITEGASTADINQQVIDYVDNFSIDDDAADTAADQTCTDGLQGSTYLDDLTYIAQHAPAADLYPLGNSQLLSDDGVWYDKQGLTTHIVVTGSLRDIDDTECSPDEIIKNAASQGGTELMVSASPADLENNLLSVFNDLRQRASAGSAASVISSARGGEGAIYQAIFWPQLTRPDDSGNDWNVEWVGDLHALFIDEHGYMYEDTNHDRKMNPYEDVDNDGHLDVDEDLDGDGILDVDEDSDGDGILDDGEDIDGDGKLDEAEDVDGDGLLDIAEDLDGDGNIDGDDKRVIIYYDETANRSRGCYNTSIVYLGYCTLPVELNQIEFVWSANDWLAKISNPDYPSPGYNWDDIYHNRSSFVSNERRRYIFTWNDLDNDGLVDDVSEVLPFIDRDTAGTPEDWASMTVTNRGPVTKDFNAADNDEIRQIVRWIRGDEWSTEDLDNDNVLDAGEDIDGDGNLDVYEDTNGNGQLDSGEDVDGDGTLESPVRSRRIPSESGGSSFISWRLGDIVHSTPMTVSSPAEGYHLIYSDQSFAKFLSRYKRRRHVVYFGGNDGMLHAVNAGFYSEKEHKFCLAPLNADGTCTDGAVGDPYPELGAELWAYVPYNIQPHLKCLLQKDYGDGSHKYYVDLRPRIFDVKIFTEEVDCTTLGTSSPGCIHPDGWGTILVGGMRLGGAPVDAAADLGQADTDNRRFISSYFILDITNPEAPPVLLGEMTQTLTDSADADTTPDTPVYTDLGYSTVIPTMVIMKQNADPLAVPPVPEVNKWYLVFGSGPHGDDGLLGVSDQDARLSVLSLNDLVLLNDPDKDIRIPASQPVSGTPDGTFVLSSYNNQGFVSDPITVDFDINPSVENYKSDAVYFGTVEGDFDMTNPSQPTWDGGGKLYRLVTRELDISDHSSYGIDTPEPDVTEPADWKIKPLIDLSTAMVDGDGDAVNPKPITAPPAVGTDGLNFWIYFGTGRFFDANDKTDSSQQTYFGIKEPMLWTSATEGTFTWDEVELTGLGTNSPGGQGLLDVSDIRVGESYSFTTANLSCRDATTDCLPADLVSAGQTTFDSLVDYTAGYGACASPYYWGCVDGWYKNFHPYGNRERNLGQATLLGGLLTFSTYQPYSDACLAEGISYLYALYYQTGTAWYESVFGIYGIDELLNVEDKLELGRGLALSPNLHVGGGGGGDDEDGSGPKVFIQTSTGEIKEIEQENVPYQIRPGKFKWKEFTK